MQNYMEFICNELEELDRKVGKEGKLSMAEVQYGDMLAHTKKNLLKADEMYDEGEYSMAGGQGGGQGGSYRYSRDGSYRGGSSRAGGSYRGSYRGGSYARGQNARRDSMGRYSREGYSRDTEELAEQLQEMMQELPPEAQTHIQKAIEKMQ